MSHEIEISASSSWLLDPDSSGLSQRTHPQVSSLLSTNTSVLNASPLQPRRPCSGVKDSLSHPAVALQWGQEIDPAMAVNVVIPMDKFLAPLTCFIKVFEPFRLIIAVVLQGFEETLRIGVVITYARSAVRWGNPKWQSVSNMIAPFTVLMSRSSILAISPGLKPKLPSSLIELIWDMLSISPFLLCLFVVSKTNDNLMGQMFQPVLIILGKSS